MKYSEMIERLMEDVRDGSTKPLIIYRDHSGEWNCEYTQNQHGETFGWVVDKKWRDPCSLIFTGKDFAKGSYPYVYDKVLTNRLHAEYDHIAESGTASDARVREFHALVNFVEDSINYISNEVTEYLVEREKPLAALSRICPINLTTYYDDWEYNEDLADNALRYIEGAVKNRLFANEQDIGEPVYGSSGTEIDVSEYTALLTTNLVGWQVTLAENMNKSEPFLVEQRREPDKGIKNDAYYCGVTADYLEAITEFTKRLQTCVDVARTNREVSKSVHGVEYYELSKSDCQPDSRNADFTGQLVVIKAAELKPEYRTADSQLVLCSHGNGARPGAIGTSVFGKELYSGHSVCYGRHQIAGIADSHKLPDWALEKLERIESEKAVQQKDAASAKPSLRDKLANAKEAARKADEEKAGNGDKPKKRNDMEV